jgi:hypothetical protein
MLSGKVTVHECAQFNPATRRTGRAQMAQRHHEKSSAGSNCGAGFGAERPMQVDVIARVGGGVVFVGRAGVASQGVRKRRECGRSAPCHLHAPHGRWKMNPAASAVLRQATPVRSSVSSRAWPADADLQTARESSAMLRTRWTSAWAAVRAPAVQLLQRLQCRAREIPVAPAAAIRADHAQEKSRPVGGGQR